MGDERKGAREGRERKEGRVVRGVGFRVRAEWFGFVGLILGFDEGESGKVGK